jgi:hypothetical protein
MIAGRFFSAMILASAAPECSAIGDVRVRAAEHRDREARLLAVGGRAQAVPHASRVQDAHAPLVGRAALDEALGGVRLAAAGLADDRDVLREQLLRVERWFSSSSPQVLLAPLHAAFAH